MTDEVVEIPHKNEDKVTSAIILSLLNQRYRPPTWAFFGEVPDATAVAHRRTIDAVAVSMWSKPGIGHTIAFEVKISRSDFKNEIADPTKRKAAIENSHEFYFVCLKGIVKPEEVPEDCGLMEVYGDKEKGTLSLRVTKIAQQRTVQTFSRQFFASMMRQSDGRVDNIDRLPILKHAGKEFSAAEFQKLVDEEANKKSDALVQSKLWHVENELKIKYHKESQDLLCKLCRIFGVVRWQHNEDSIIQAIDQAARKAAAGVSEDRMVKLVQGVVSALIENTAGNQNLVDPLYKASQACSTELSRLSAMPLPVFEVKPSPLSDEEKEALDELPD